MEWQKKVVTDLAVIFSVGCFIGFLAPFGMDSMATHVRIFFWVLVCTVGYLIYKPCIHIAEAKLNPFVRQYWLRISAGALFASFPATVALLAVNNAFFDMEINWVTDSIRLFPKVLLIGGVISAISILKNIAEDQKQALVVSNKNNEKLQAKLTQDPYKKLIQQLPVEKRGDLISIETADHYLNITTDKGSHLLLMRFKDALTLLEHAPGLQVHRSWWVAIDHVEHVEKQERKWQLRLSSGALVPVSKTFLPQVKGTGLK